VAYIAIIGYDEPAEQTFEVFVVEWWNRQAGGIAFNNMEIGKALSRQLFCDVVEKYLRIAVSYVVLSVLRRNTYARAFGAGGGADCIDDFPQEPAAIRDVPSTENCRDFRGLIRRAPVSLLSNFRFRSQFSRLYLRNDRQATLKLPMPPLKFYEP
jgi:hypothetical protein